jgi:DNA-binding MarR family transcriptional regulator
MKLEEMARHVHHLAYSPGDALFRDMGFAYWALVKAAERHIGLPRARARLLGHAAMAGGEISQAELQKQMAIDGAAVTRQVKLLEAEGLVTRRHDPADNRVTLVMVTAAGRQKLQDVAARAHTFASTCMTGIDPKDAETVTRVLARMRENVAGLGDTEDIDDSHCPLHHEH